MDSLSVIFLCVCLNNLCVTELLTQSDLQNAIAWKVSKYRVFSGPYFPVFVLRIPSEYRKIRTKKLRIWRLFTQWLSCLSGNWKENIFILLLLHINYLKNSIATHNLSFTNNTDVILFFIWKYREAVLNFHLEPACLTYARCASKEVNDIG